MCNVTSRMLGVAHEMPGFSAQNDIVKFGFLQLPDIYLFWLSEESHAGPLELVDAVHNLVFVVPLVEEFFSRLLLLCAFEILIQTCRGKFWVNLFTFKL